MSAVLDLRFDRHFTNHGRPMTMLTLHDETGAALNANVEVSAGGIVLHSRSGTERNRDYRPALEQILARLDRLGAAYEVFLDSRPAQRLPLEQRQLKFDRTAPVETRFNQIVQAMNAGSASHGAWRRILITTAGVGSADIRAALTGNDSTAPVERLTAEQLRKVTAVNIDRAVARLLAGEDTSNFAPSRDYDALTDDGVALSPKKVFGLALEDALGIEVFPGHFSAGWGHVSFELLEQAGLWIVPKSGVSPRPKPKPTDEPELAGLAPTEEERSWIEGNPRMVSHLVRERQHGLAKQKRAEFVAQHGRLFCEECQLDPVAMYGAETGPACIEVHHHRVFISDMQPGHVTVLEDLKCLCANCHRVLHRKLALGFGH